MCAHGAKTKLTYALNSLHRAGLQEVNDKRLMSGRIYFRVKGLFSPLYVVILRQCFPPKICMTFVTRKKTSPVGNKVDYEVEDQDEMCRAVNFVRVQSQWC